MITTYRSAKTGIRGCSVFKADNPLGPFREISNGHITPHNSDSIDGTLYIDKNGKPYFVFVDEWVGNEDGVGRMSVAELSDDLTNIISEPKELFRADDVAWKSDVITDGCWLYTTNKGSLLMLWSNFEYDRENGKGYVVTVARSTTGLVDGPWVQENMLYSRRVANSELDGGHGMIFKDSDGKMMLSIHSPNTEIRDRKESPVFIPVIEKDDTLILNI